MKIQTEQEEILKGEICDILAINPLTSIRRMQDVIEQKIGRKLSDKYTAKLMYKVRRKVVMDSDRKKLNERLTEVRERHRILIEDLNRTIYWRKKYFDSHGIKDPNFKERLAAMKLVAQLDRSLFQMELQAGMFEDRRIAIEEMLREGILPTELREQIVKIFKKWTYKSYRNTEQEMGVVAKS